MNSTSQPEEYQQKPTFIFVGHSHINALIAATTHFPELPQNSIFVHCLHHAKDEPLIYKSANGESSLNRHISKSIDDAIKSNKKPILISLLGGNSHNMLALLEHPTPFHFLTPNDETIMVEKNTSNTKQFIPYSQMYEIMESRAKGYLSSFDVLRKEFPVKIYHIESPPPIGSDYHIEKNMGAYFEDQRNERKISPPETRRGLWKLHSQVFKNYCEKHNITFIPIPTSTLDPEGFLDPKGYPDDATHGNFWYGKEVITDLMQRFYND